MAGVLQLQHGGIVHQRPAVAVERGHLREGGQDVQLGDRPGGALDAGHLIRHPLPDLHEELVLQLHHPLRGVEHLLLQLLQLRRDEPLLVGEGLLADVVRGYQGQVGLGDREVIAKNLIVPNLK